MRTGVHDYFLRTDVYGSNIGLTEKTALEVPDDKVPVLREGSIEPSLPGYPISLWPGRLREFSSSCITR